MLRASSEMAVAISVASVPEKPNRPASSRPFWRAKTRSESDPMEMRSSSTTVACLLAQSVQERQALFQVERGADTLQSEPHLHDGECDLWPDPHDDGVGSSELCGDGHGVERSRDE